ncbi:class III lanthipeptide [Kitasatospora sp. NPDC096147]
MAEILNLQNLSVADIEEKRDEWSTISNHCAAPQGEPEAI